MLFNLNAFFCTVFVNPDSKHLDTRLSVWTAGNQLCRTPISAALYRLVLNRVCKSRLLALYTITLNVVVNQRQPTSVYLILSRLIRVS